jgi:hypothetical protein
MGKLKYKLVGKTKEIVAEVTGDGKLAEEGSKQIKNRASEPKPLTEEGSVPGKAMPPVDR